MKTMNPTPIGNHLRVVLKHSALAAAVAAGLAGGSVQAQTTTQTYDLGPQDAGTSINTQAVLPTPWIAAGTLPVGSILRSVSINARLDIEGGGDTYADDLFVYVDPGTPASGSEILQVGGYDVLGSPTTYITWGSGHTGAIGTTCVATKTAPANFPDTIDLNSAGLYLGSRGWAPASWSGTLTVEYDLPPPPARILSFGPGAVIDQEADPKTIAWTVPNGTPLTTLLPTITLSSGVCAPASGESPVLDGANQATYTVTDPDTLPDPTENVYILTVTEAPPETTLIWNTGGGTWDLAAPNWIGQTTPVIMPFFNGANVIFDKTAGGTIAIAADMSPLSTTVSAASGTYTFSGNPITTGSLNKSGGGTLQLNVTPANFSSIAVTGGTLYLYAAETGFAPNAAPFTIPNVTVESGATLEAYRAHATGGTLTLNGGRYWEWNGWNDGGWWGPIYLASDSYFGRSEFWCYAQTLGGEISGPGGFTYDSFNNNQGAPLTLSVANSYEGPTIVNSGKVVCKDPSSLGNGGALSIGTGAKVALDYTGDHAVASLTLGGVLMTNPGTYGSLASAATFKSAYFDGTGTVSYGVPESFAYITSFGTNVPGSYATIGTVDANVATITWLVPPGTDFGTLAPDFELSPGAMCLNQTSTLEPDPGFDAGSVVYTVKSQDESITNSYTVTAVFLPVESTVLWNVDGGGDWNLSTFNWLGQSSGLPTTFFDGVNVIFDKTAGGTIAIASDMSPLTTTVNAASGTYTFSGGPIASGSLTKDGTGTLVMAKANSYDGGTIITNGTLRLEWPGDGVSHTTLGSGPVTLDGGTLYLYRTDLANALTVNGGTLVAENGFGNNYSGPITLNATLPCNVFYTLVCSNTISGPGGLTKNNGGPMTLSGTNSYQGPTTVTGGTLQCNLPDSLGSGALSISTGGAKVNLNYSGTKSISSLTLGGLAQTAPGTYGSGDSGADFQSAYFAGNGTVTLAPPAYMIAFGTNVPGSSAVIDPVVGTTANIVWTVPYGTVLASLAPTFTMSFDATCSERNTGDLPDPGFGAGSVVYTVVSLDPAITNVYTVSVVIAPPIASVTYNLGTSPAGTVFTSGGTSSLFVWIAKGDLPVGSILRSVTATNIKLEANPGDNYAGDIGVVVDPSPEVRGGADNLLTINNENGAGAFGGTVHTDWAGQGWDYPPFSATVSAPTNFPDAIDLHDGAVMFGSSYGAGTYSGTITVAYNGVGNDIVSFGLPGNPAVITLAPGANTIALDVPYLTDVSSLAPVFIMSNGATCKANDAPVVSGVTLIDFTDPVVYTVTAADGISTNDYTVTVTVAPPPPTFRWKGTNGADWSVAGNWNNTVPGATNIAVLSDSASAGATVNLDTDVTVGGLTFNNKVANQTIASTGGKTLTLASGSKVTVDAGSHSISAKVNADGT